MSVPPDVPKKIGKYGVEKVLGRGAMGVVYLGTDSTIDRPVAIKTIHMPEALGDERIQEFRERFLREARAAGRMNHSAIVTIYEANDGSEGGLPFIAMEYVEGTPWNVRIKKAGAQDPEDVLPLVSELASALDYAHRRGIIHRDIKPANIIQTPDGHVKLMDFGIARVPTSELTQEGQCPGTPAYMSPEQVRGEKVDGRSDLFSLGTVLFELLTGQKPFPGESITSITTQILMKPTPSALQIRPLLNPDVDLMLRHLLAKDPAQRYATAKELVEDIDAYMAGASLPHAGTSAPTDSRVEVGVEQHAKPASAPAAGALSEEGTVPSPGTVPAAEPFTEPASVVAHRASGGAPTAIAARRGRSLKPLLVLGAAVAVLAVAAALAALFFAGAFEGEPEPDLSTTNRLAAELAIPKRPPPETAARTAPAATPEMPKAKPKPKPRPKPEEPPPAPAQNEPAEPPPPPPPPPDATVSYTFKSGIVRGEFWIKVDGKEAVHHVINRKASLSTETYAGSFSAPPGTHSVRFEVRTELQNVKGVHEEQVVLESGKPRTLRIVMTKFNKELRFEWAP